MKRRNSGIIVFICITIISLIGCSGLSPQAKYQEGLDAVQNEQWEEASEIFQALGEYKDSGRFRVYVTIHLDYNKFAQNGIAAIEEINGYKEYKPYEIRYKLGKRGGEIFDIPQLLGNSEKWDEAKTYYYFIDRLHDFTSKNDKDDSEILKSSCIAFNDLLNLKIDEIKEEQEQINQKIKEDYKHRRNEFLNTVIAYYENGEYEKGKSYIFDYDIIVDGKNKKKTLLDSSDEELFTLFRYSFVLDSDESQLKKLMAEISPNYDGIYSEIIIPHGLTVFDTKAAWDKEYQIVHAKRLEIEQEIRDSLNAKPPSAPKIGMTAEEVEKSSWGKPEKINSTTTRYGVNEQWVYSGNRYVYLEDGIVTAIQDSR